MRILVGRVVETIHFAVMWEATLVMWEAILFDPLPLDLGEKLQKFSGISGRHLVSLHETDQVQIDEPSVFGVFGERPGHGGVAALDEAELHGSRDVEAAVSCHDLGNDIQALPGFAEAFIVEAGQRNVIRHENNAHSACQPQVRMQFVGRSYFRLDHFKGDSRDLSSAAKYQRRGTQYRRIEIL